MLRSLIAIALPLVAPCLGALLGCSEAWAAPALVHEEARPTELAWSPRGDLLAVGSHKTWLVGGNEPVLIAARPSQGAVTWDRSGKQLVYVVQSPQGLWDLLWLDRVLNERRVLRSGEGLSDLQWVPRQRAVLAIERTEGPARLIRVDVETGETTTPCGHAGEQAGVRVSPNGKFAAFLQTSDDRGARVQTCDLATGEVTDRGSAGDDTFDRAVAWSHDSKQIVVLRDRPRGPRYTTIDLATGEWNDNPHCAGRSAEQIAWNRYGDILALDTTNRTLYACTVLGVQKVVVGSTEAFSAHPKQRTVAAWVKGTQVPEMYRQSAPSKLPTSTITPVYTKSGVYVVEIEEGVKAPKAPKAPKD
jgi:dipeptidyl aminopeptidase/acylaminoacyl peptidase